jgi:transcriptional regulator with XRE-family HTH domain
MEKSKSNQEGEKEKREETQHSDSAETSGTNIKIRKQFGGILRKVRKVRGKSIYELAAEAEVDAGYISRLENAHRNPPSPKILQRFANALEISIDLLMMAAGYLEYDLDGSPLNEEVITRKIEKAITEDHPELEQKIKAPSPSEEDDDTTMILPLIKEGDVCVGSTDDGDSIKGLVILLIQTEKGATQVSEILHRVES